MKNLLKVLSLTMIAGLLLAACKSTPKSTTLMLDPDVEYSVECKNIIERRLPDGRMEIAAYVRNKETRRIQVQINCVFKDATGFPTEGEETPFRNLILSENAEEPVIFTALNDKAKIYAIRIRQAH